IVVPQLGESVAEGTVSKWLKAVGERVRKEEPLVEIQTDKINVEIPSPAEGILEQILIPEGTTVLVGTEIGVLSGAGEAPAAAARPAAAAAQPAGASAAASPPVATATATAVPPAASEAAASGNGGAALEDRTLSPSVRKIMREQNVSTQEVSAIRGSGVAGRVTRDDLLEYLQTRAQRPAAAAAPASGFAVAPDSTVPAAPAAVPAGPPPAFLAARVTPAAPGPREEVVPFSQVRK